MAAAGMLANLGMHLGRAADVAVQGCAVCGSDLGQALRCPPTTKAPAPTPGKQSLRGQLLSLRLGGGVWGQRAGPRGTHLPPGTTSGACEQRSHSREESRSFTTRLK